METWPYQRPPLYPISSLLTAKGVDLVVACDGFPRNHHSLIAEVLLEQFLICNAM